MVLIFFNSLEENNPKHTEFVQGAVSSLVFRRATIFIVIKKVFYLIKISCLITDHLVPQNPHPLSMERSHLVW